MSKLSNIIALLLMVILVSCGADNGSDLSGGGGTYSSENCVRVDTSQAPFRVVRIDYEDGHYSITNYYENYCSITYYY